MGCDASQAIQILNDEELWYHNILYILFSGYQKEWNRRSYSSFRVLVNKNISTFIILKR